MEPHIDKIVRSHTDSIFATEKLEIATGDKLGELRYEGFCPNFKIDNSIAFEGEFSLEST